MQQILTHDKHYSQRLATVGNGRIAHAIAWLLARSGDSWFWLVVALLLIWRQQPLGWTLLIYTAVTAIIVAIAKGIFRRSRPSGPGRTIATDKYAFPSGHAARVAAIAIVLADALGFVPLLLLWALCVALARVALARHYLTDIIGGLAVGLIVSLVGTAVW